MWVGTTQLIQITRSSPLTFKRFCHQINTDEVFGTHTYIETDPSEADRDTIVRNMIAGQYDHPVGVITLNPTKGWSRDVSEEIARAVLMAAERIR
jgi:hypothetical protein